MTAVGSITDGAVLLVGKGHSGKSTAALACLAAGMNYLSDDYCFVTTSPPFHVQSLYCSGKIHEKDIWKFSEFLSYESSLECLYGEKKIIFLSSVFGKSIRAPNKTVR